MNILKIYLVFVFSFVALGAIIAQPGTPGSGPIGGVVYLLLAGLGFAVFKLRNKEK